MSDPYQAPAAPLARALPPDPGLRCILVRALAWALLIHAVLLGVGVGVDLAALAWTAGRSALAPSAVSKAHHLVASSALVLLVLIFEWRTPGRRLLPLLTLFAATLVLHEAWPYTGLRRAMGDVDPFALARDAIVAALALAIFAISRRRHAPQEISRTDVR